jgi:hypothetical protein
MIRWADIPSGSVGIYGNQRARMLDGIWAEIGGALLTLGEDPDPNITGYVLDYGLSEAGPAIGSSYARYVYPSSAATAGIATRVWLKNIPSAVNYRPTIHIYSDGTNTPIVSICVSPTGAIQAYRGMPQDGGTLIGATAGPVMVANSWRHIESKVHPNAATGTVEVRVEGVVVLNLTNVNTGTGPVEQVSMCNGRIVASEGTPMGLKDVIFWDTSGSENNDFIGPCTVYWRPMASDVSSGWSRTSGSTDYGLVDESPPDDTGYIYADDTLPAPSIMEPQPLPPDVVSIRAIISVSRAQKSDGGDGKLQVSMSPNGTDWDTGADNPVSTAFTYYYDVSEVSPATTAPWSPTEFPPQVRLNRTV